MVSEGRSLQQDFANADLLLCDVSAVANDWLSTGRPLIITRSADRQAQDAATELLGVVPRLTQAKAEQAGQIARDRKSTRLNSSHVATSYAVFCLNKKT